MKTMSRRGILGLSIENRSVAGVPAGDRFAQRAGDNKLQVLLKAINEKISTHAVIFDVSTDRGIRSGNQSLAEIMYGLFLQSLGYAKDLDLSELEIATATTSPSAWLMARRETKEKGGDCRHPSLSAR
jgi:hypothetical protein